MKTLHLIIIALLPLFCVGQSIQLDPDTKLYTYSIVVDANGQTKDEIFTKVHKWFAATYNSANDVIQMSDKEGGEIVGKGRFKMGIIPYDYTLSISVKDGKYKFTADNLTTGEIKDQFEKYPEKRVRKHLDKIEAHLATLNKSLNESVNQTKKDW